MLVDHFKVIFKKFCIFLYLFAIFFLILAQKDVKTLKKTEKEDFVQTMASASCSKSTTQRQILPYKSNHTCDIVCIVGSRGASQLGGIF